MIRNTARCVSSHRGARERQNGAHVQSAWETILNTNQSSEARHDCQGDEEQQGKPWLAPKDGEGVSIPLCSKRSPLMKSSGNLQTRRRLFCDLVEEAVEQRFRTASLRARRIIYHGGFTAPWNMKSLTTLGVPCLTRPSRSISKQAKLPKHIPIGCSVTTISSPL